MSAPWKIFPTISRRLLPDFRKIIDQLTGQVNDIINNYQKKDEKNQPGGYVGLENDGKINSQFLPAIAITDVYIAASQEEQDAINPQSGDVVVRVDIDRSFIWDGSQWQELLQPPAPVQSVDGRTGNVTLADIYAAINHNHSFINLTDTPNTYDTGKVAIANTNNVIWGYTDRIRKKINDIFDFIYNGGTAYGCGGTEFSTEFDVVEKIIFDAFCLSGYMGNSRIRVKIETDGNIIYNNEIDVVRCDPYTPCYEEYGFSDAFSRWVVDLEQKLTLLDGQHVVIYLSSIDGNNIAMSNINISTTKATNFVSHNNDLALDGSGCSPTFEGKSLIYDLHLGIEGYARITDDGKVVFYEPSFDTEKHLSDIITDINNHETNITTLQNTKAEKTLSNVLPDDVLNRLNQATGNININTTLFGGRTPTEYQQVVSNNAYIRYKQDVNGNYVNTWIKAFKLNSFDYRIMGRLECITIGGSYTPDYSRIIFKKTWGNTAPLKVQEIILGSYIRGIGYTNDGYLILLLTGPLELRGPLYLVFNELNYENLIDNVILEQYTSSNGNTYNVYPVVDDESTIVSSTIFPSNGNYIYESLDVNVGFEQNVNEPTVKYPGKLWYDGTNLKVYTGNNWITLQSQ